MAYWKGVYIDDEVVDELENSEFGRQMLDQAAEGTTPIGRLKQYCTGERSLLFDAAEEIEDIFESIFDF